MSHEVKSLILTSSRPSQDPSAMPRPTSQDLAGFWDLLQLSIDDVTMKFDQLQQIKNNNWRAVDSPEKKVRDGLCLTTCDEHPVTLLSSS